MHSDEKFAHSVVYFSIYILWPLPISDVKDIKGKTLTGNLDRLIGIKVIDGKTKPSKFSNHRIPSISRYFILFLFFYRFSRVLHATDFREFPILLFQFSCLRETLEWFVNIESCRDPSLCPYEWKTWFVEFSDGKLINRRRMKHV